MREQGRQRTSAPLPGDAVHLRSLPSGTDRERIVPTTELRLRVRFATTGEVIESAADAVRHDALDAAGG